MDYLTLTPTVECVGDGEIHEADPGSEGGLSVVDDLKLQVHFILICLCNLSQIVTG